MNLIIQAIRLKTLRHYLIFEGQLCLKKDHHRGQGVQLLMHLQSTKRYGVVNDKNGFWIIDYESKKVRVNQTLRTSISLHY